MDQDYLTCGLCLKEFPLQQITLFIQHKKLDCEEDSGTHFEETDLKCYYCPRGFMTAWGLLVHVQLTHSMRIFVEKTSLSITTQPNQKYGSTQHISTPQLKVSPKGNVDESKSLTLQNRQIVLNNNPNSEITQSLNVSGNADVNLAPGNINTSNDLDRNRILSSNNATDFVENNIPNKAFDCQSLPKDSIKLYSHLDVSKLGQSVDNEVAHHYTKTAQQTESLSTVYTPLSKHITQKTPYEVVHKSKNDIYPMVKDIRAVPGEIVQRSPPPLDKTSNEANLACVDSKQIDTEMNLQGESGAKQIPETNDEQLCERGNDREQGYENRVDDENDDINDCCDNQGCGITVIPGSHQDLQECCNAVVPKKRKRHMELKHMPFSYSSSRYARRRMLQRSLTLASKSSTVTHNDPPASGTNTIFIDVEPDTFTENSKAINSDNHTASSTDSGPETKDSKSISMTMLPPPDPDSKSKSLILQPGAIFSIPFSYSLPNSNSRTSSSIPISIVQAHLSGKQTVSNSVTNKTLIPVSSEAIGQGHNQESMSQTDEADISSGELIIADSDGRRRKYPTSKPFKCDRCPMAFNQRIHLKKHMSKHTGIKPYKCGECDYSTVERSHLKVHIRIHTGEKPFKCTYCEYATAQNSTLKIHLKRHHGGKMFACHDCDKTFTQIEQLQGHQTEHVSGNGGLSVIKKKSSGIDMKPGSSEVERQSPGKEGSSINLGKDSTKTSVENTTVNDEMKDNTNSSVINSNNSPKLVIDTEKETSVKKD